MVAAAAAAVDAVCWFVRAHACLGIFHLNWNSLRVATATAAVGCPCVVVLPLTLCGVLTNTNIYTNMCA